MARASAIAVAAVLAMPAAAGPAHAQRPVGGTLDLNLTSEARSEVVSERRVAAVAMLRGRPDVAVVGEPTADGAAGRVRLVRLEAGEFERDEEFAIAGPGRRARAGAALAAVDELVGDGDSDVLVGAPGTLVAGRGRPGAAFLIPGGNRSSRLVIGDPDAVTILGVADGDRTGAAVASVPDVDGDDRPDLIIGAPDADPGGRSKAGSVFLVPSRGLRLGDTVDLANPEDALRIDGPAEGARAGRAVAGSRDTNGDGQGDVIVGAPGLSAAYVVRAALGQPVDLAAGGAAVVVLLGASGERAGTAVAGPGDMDDDGRPDIAVGAPNASVPGRGRTGVVYVLAPPPGAGSFALSEASERIEGEAPGDRAGSRLARAGNAVGKEIPDLMIAARGADPLGHPGAGATYVVAGRSAVNGVDLALLGFGGFRIAGDSDGAALGTAIAGDVDVDDDGRDDVLAGGLGTEPSALLQKAPSLPEKPDPKPGCDSRPAAMVLDASEALAKSASSALRGGALELLLGHPATDDRPLEAVTAAPLPAEVFAPLTPGQLTSERRADVVEDLVDEAIKRSYEGGDLREALDKVEDRSPSTRSSIVVAGPDATWSAGDAPPFRTDVVGVGVARGSAPDSTLRSLATASGGRYRRVRARQLQAQVAHLDALRRCEKPLPSLINGRLARLQDDVSANEVPLGPGYELEVRAEAPRDTLFVDMVLTWTSPAGPIEPYELKVDAGSDGLSVAEFTEADLTLAERQQGVEKERVTLTVGAGDTFKILRVSFHGEDEAQTSRHRTHLIHYGGHRAYGAHAAAPQGWGSVQLFHRTAPE